MPEPKPALRPGALRIDDADTFIRVYEAALTRPVEERSSFRKLFTGVSGEKEFGTVYDRLRSLGGLFLGAGAGLDELFKVQSSLGGLEPTPTAHLLYKHLRHVKLAYDQARQGIQEFRQRSPRPLVTAAAPQTICHRLLSSIFSDWDNQFGRHMKLRLVVENAPALIQKLNLGLVDFVIAYGPATQHTEREMDVCFKPMNYYSRMLLLAHPAAPLFLTDRTDANAGYWKSKYRPNPNKKQEQLGYKDLRKVDLADVDFTRTHLIVVPSHQQPRAIQDLTDALRPSGRVQEVPWYDEALALVRTGLGTAIVTEVFARSPRVTAFKLMPTGRYTRWIGVYYNTRHGLTREACCLVEFIRAYLIQYQTEVRAGTPPAYSDPGFPPQKFQTFYESKDWAAEANDLYPIVAPASRTE